MDHGRVDCGAIEWAALATPSSPGRLSQSAWCCMSSQCGGARGFARLPSGWQLGRKAQRSDGIALSQEVNKRVSEVNKNGGSPESRKDWDDV